MRSGGVFLEESARVVEGKQTGLRRVCYYDRFFPFCILLEEIKSLSTLVQKSQLRAPFGSDAYSQDVFFWLDVLGVVASSKPSPESSDQFMLIPYPCESCKLIRHLAVHCFRP